MVNSIILLARGHSELEFRNMKERPTADEIWCVNALGYHYRDADKIFYMDDMHEVPPQEHYADYLKNECQIPVITSKAYPEYPTAQDLPINDVINFLKDEPLTKKLLACTVAHALVYADMLGVKEINCWGIDCGENPPELSLATAYQIGRLIGKGVKVNMSSGSKLSNIKIFHRGDMPFYGYYKEN